MPQTSSRSRRGKSSRMGRGLKITIALLLAFLVLIVLNAFALNNETEPATVTVEGATLVDTSSGPLQVLDTGAPDAAPAEPGETAVEPLPVVLIHGTGGAINWWDELVPLLSPERRVVAIDLLGFGGSAKPKDGYSIDSQGGLVAQALNAIGIEQAVVVGHSLGAKVATSLTEQSPELVAGLVNIDMAPDSSFGGLNSTAKAAQWPLLGQALWRVSPDFMVRKNLEQAFAPDFGDIPDKYVEDIRALTYPSYSDTFEASNDYTDEQPLDDRLEATGKPLLVIFGEEDQLYDDPREAISAYAAIPGVQTLLIPEVGHSPQVEAPEQTAAAINEFADSLAPEPEPEPAPKPKPKPKNNQKNQQNQQGQNNRQNQQGQNKQQNQIQQGQQKQPANQ